MFIQIFNAFNNNSVYTKDTDWCRQTHLQTVNMVNWCFMSLQKRIENVLYREKTTYYNIELQNMSYNGKQIAYLRIFPKSSETHREVVLLSL